MSAATLAVEGDDGPLRLGKKKPSDDEIDITPMIDIVFLLLIFFVVASKMDPQKAHPVPKATLGTGVASNDSAVILMSRGNEDRAVVERGDGGAFIDDDEQQRIDIIDYIHEQKALGKTHVMILGARDVSVGEVGRIQRIIRDGFEGEEPTYLAVQEE